MTSGWTSGNTISLLENGDEFFPRMIEAIDSSQKEVLLETFILLDDPVGREVQKALLRAAARGVWVSVLVDGYGSHYLPQTFIDELRDAGIRFDIYHPQPRWLRVRTNIFRRMHRKLVVVDGAVAFIGGINLAHNHRSDFGPDFKQDYAAEIIGPGVAPIRAYIHEAIQHYSQSYVQFPELRNDLKPAVKGEAKIRFLGRDNNKCKTNIENEYLKRVRASKHTIIMANPYFFPGYRLLKGLRDAARRGVKVCLLIQGKPGSPLAKFGARLLYDFLVESEVNVYEYWERQLHAKIAAFDDEWATIGSSNLDPLSLCLNLEANVFVRDRAFNSLIQSRIQALIDQSYVRQIDQSWIRRRTMLKGFTSFLVYHFLRHFPGLTGWVPPLSSKVGLAIRRAQSSKSDTGDGV
ncbi:cardiolipin synthase ClsB [Marinimicrobium sp. ABcell2]|uniref:cardiolipin synthase ClsB n=1 Tax=Marinimicrobium sp. ABcell2 TaxID=3069751 RepID=UPI0027B0E8C9|nr:cardiolipin synthase ClsB [Marinimicrobium sp. ABcell2]MDQ2077874.1 cardiolipin synthase ClsB [Marinimicrobium sp. ABcell2]